MADDGRVIDHLLTALAGRDHLKPEQFWLALDRGEIKLRELFPETTLTTGFRGAVREGIAMVSLYKVSGSSGSGFELITRLEENIQEFPSEHLIAQIVLVVG